MNKAANPSEKTGTLYTISAPSGAGKTSLVKALLEAERGICVSVSHTTRPRRPGEIDGENYHFVSQQSFEELIDNGAFLEFAKVFTNYYGTSQEAVEHALSSGTDVILEIDWQGASQVREKLTDTVSIFILPPSTASLRERLTDRGQDSDDVIERRMAEAKSEMSHFNDADFLVINDQFDEALHDLRSIIQTQRLTLAKQTEIHGDLLEDLLS